MSQQAGFSVRSLLAFTAVAALFLGPVAAPSVSWVFPVATLAIGVVVFAMQWSVASPAARPLWLSFLVGVGFTFLLLFALHYGYQSQSLPEPFVSFVAEPVWRTVHDGPLYAGIDEYKRFKAYAFCLQIATMILPSLIAAALFSMFTPRKIPEK
ncbi:hypothetical protein [Lacipirellula parvula]|uniref:Uncharacterized protein n=1 Tax=Lacipirellula parvula TaxID=2650471 RepID=A0A5K7XDV7_9BACT|nr:hypothetical protein [Lacipirellula parvula]BBO32526.1 hypothetical protein PLANPX_2138 [Lacipirellula parvula]